MRSASSALTLRELQSSSSARPAPNKRGRIQLVPCSEISPRFENTVVNEASLEAKRTSLMHASTKPPPAAGPFTAAITGFGTRSK